jgi:hypothetical protein
MAHSNELTVKDHAALVLHKLTGSAWHECRGEGEENHLISSQEKSEELIGILNSLKDMGAVDWKEVTVSSNKYDVAKDIHVPTTNSQLQIIKYDLPLLEAFAEQSPALTIDTSEVTHTPSLNVLKKYVTSRHHTHDIGLSFWDAEANGKTNANGKHMRIAAETPEGREAIEVIHALVRKLSPQAITSHVHGKFLEIKDTAMVAALEEATQKQSAPVAVAT